MTPPDSPKIPSSTGSDNRPAVPRRAPTRAELAAATVGVLQKGSREKADLLLVDLGEGAMVVKDFSGKPWRTRLLGRIQIHRERKAYGWLGTMPGIPGFIGAIDPLAIAIERIEGIRLHSSPDAKSRGEEHLGKLRALIDRLHGAGVVHNDLRGSENLMLRPDGELVLLDLAGAVRLRPGGLAHRLLFKRLALTDEAAYLKWKEYLTPGRFTAEEEEFLRRFRVLRRMWPFNRKTPRPKGARP